MILPDHNRLVRGWKFLQHRRHMYQLAWRGEKFALTTETQEMLHDLATFCRANESTFDPDPRVHALLEGRREVWLRLMQHLKLPIEDQFMLANGKHVHVVSAATSEEYDDPDHD